MPRGIYKRKGQKSGVRRLSATTASNVGPDREGRKTFVVEVEQRRRIAVYVKANDVSEANDMAREYIYRQKKVMKPVVLPGAVIETSGMESRGVSVVDVLLYSPDQPYAKAAETPIQKVWLKDRSRSKKSVMVESLGVSPSYKILPVRAK